MQKQKTKMGGEKTKETAFEANICTAWKSNEVIILKLQLEKKWILLNKNVQSIVKIFHSLQKNIFYHRTKILRLFYLDMNSRRIFNNL